MTLLPDSLLALAKQGAHLRVDAKQLSINQINLLAAAVADSGGRISIANADSLNSSQAAALVAVGGKCVELDLT